MRNLFTIFTIHIGIIASGLLLAAPLSGHAAMQTFSANGELVSLFVPDGWCPLDRARLAKLQGGQVNIGQNTVVSTFTPCAGLENTTEPLDTWGIWMVQNKKIDTRISRPTFLSGIAETMKTSTKFQGKLLGMDNHAIYVGMDLEDGDGGVEGVLAMTNLNGNVFSLNLYRNKNSTVPMNLLNNSQYVMKTTFAGKGKTTGHAPHQPGNAGTRMVEKGIQGMIAGGVIAGFVAILAMLSSGGRKKT